MITRHPFRNTFIVKHMILPRERGGILQPHNILKMWEDRHRAWHRAFKDRTIPEIILDLPIYSRYNNMGPDWKEVFGGKTRDQAIEFLERIYLIKSALKRR